MIIRPIPIKFDGKIATDHKLDAGKFSDALFGLNRLANSSFYLLDNWSIPTNRQRSPTMTLVSPPKNACYEFLMEIAAPDGALPLVTNVIATQGQELIWRLVSCTLLQNSQRHQELDPHLDALTKILHQVLKDRNTSEERFVNLVESLAIANQNASAKLVSNIGGDANSMCISSDHGKTKIDLEDAEIIRERGETTVGEAQKYLCKVDGLIAHSRTLKLITEDHPERIITAKVVDPVFHQTGNIYVRAYDTRSTIVVTAKPLKADDELKKLVVSDAKEP